MMSRLSHTIPTPLRDYWSILTDIPGWPSAPLSRRLLRIYPLLLPLLLATAILLWRLTSLAPEHQRQLDAYSPLIGLESEVSQMRDTATTTSTPPDITSLSSLLHSSNEGSEFLEQLRIRIKALGWKFNYTLGEPADPAPETPLLQKISLRAQLSPSISSPRSFDELLRILSLLSQQEKRLDLMRLALRADDKGNIRADLQLSLTLITPEIPTSP